MRPGRSTTRCGVRSIGMHIAMNIAECRSIATLAVAACSSAFAVTESGLGKSSAAATDALAALRSCEERSERLETEFRVTCLRPRPLGSQEPWDQTDVSSSWNVSWQSYDGLIRILRK